MLLTRPVVFNKEQQHLFVNVRVAKGGFFQASHAFGPAHTQIFGTNTCCGWPT